jgi:hypothetical protein
MEADEISVRSSSDTMLLVSPSILPILLFVIVIFHRRAEVHVSPAHPSTLNPRQTPEQDLSTLNPR